MLYKFVAKDAEGKKINGEVVAFDRLSAINTIKKMNLILIEVNEINQNASKGWSEIEIFEKNIYKAKLKKKKLIAITNQLAIMMKAGVSIPLAMDVLIGQEKDLTCRKILKIVNEDMLSGISFSKSMSKFKAFPKIITNMISAGELNGRLDIAFAMAADNLTKESELSGKVKGAMAYPLFLLATTVIEVVFMNIFILPRFKSLFEGINTDLPLITRIVMFSSAIMVKYWYIVLGLPIILVISYILARKKSNSFCIFVDYIKLKTPLFGMLTKKALTARFCRILVSLVEAGVGIVEALEISSDVINNTYMADSIDKVIDDVKIGIPINNAMSKQRVFAPLLISMVRVGEESGTLGDVLGKMASMFEAEAEVETKQLTSLMEPIMTVLIAVIVGIMVVAIMLPMFSMYGAVGNLTGS